MAKIELHGVSYIKLQFNIEAFNETGRIGAALTHAILFMMRSTGNADLSNGTFRTKIK